jgi:AAA domain
LVDASLAATFRPTEKQDAFLRTLGMVIDATERITVATETGDSYPYCEARPTAGSRSSATQAYEFTLAGVRIPEQGAFVLIACRAGAGAGTVRVRGQVTRVSGMTITVRFDEPVDWNDLLGQGEITTTSSTVVFRMQREALSQFRTGQARNPGVLRALIDGQADPPWDGQRAIQTPPSPASDLNLRQREAFDKVLAGRPDLVAVIGPPGTGKTTTITEIVRAAAAHGGRIIICSQNNRDVLGRLPEELLAIRVGNEVSVTAEGIPYLLQRQAADLRTQILNKSLRRLGDYEGLGDAEGWAAELAQCNAALTVGRLGEAQALSGLDSARRAAGEPAAGEVDRLTEAHAERKLEASHCAERLVRLNQLSEQAAARSRWVIIGWTFGLLAFIDTSALDWSARRDRSGQDRERFGQRGYDNPGEARRGVVAVRATGLARQSCGP